MAMALILFPLLMVALAAAVPSNAHRPWLLPLTGLLHLGGVWALLMPPFGNTVGGLALDPPGRLLLLLIGVLFLMCSFHAAGYLRNRLERCNRVFCICMLALLGAMDLAICSRHLGVMWVAMETAALLAAPLIYFNRTPHSIEATWKYLVVGFVGIALALLGTFFLAYAALHAGLEPKLTFDNLLQHAPQLSKPWLHAAFALLLIGYGTKMGLAPMHTWKADAYGEAPGVVGALLAGGMTSCAFLALLRVWHIFSAAGEQAFTSRWLMALGLLSMAVAGIFMAGQRDMKRMLANSSIEHMGILAFGLGLGGPALFGTLLHVITNSLTKGALFLSAGNIQSAFASKHMGQVQGALRRLPISGAVFLAGFMAITGSPPFGPFVSIFAILNGAFDARHGVTAGIFLLLLLVVFIGMGATVLQMVQGRPPEDVRQGAYRDRWLTAAPPLALIILVLGLGLHAPDSLTTMIQHAVRYLEVHP